VVEITTRKLTGSDLARAIDSVRTDLDGAVVTFLGVVRRWSEGREVARLEYEAYEEMARNTMRRIVDEIKRRWNARAAIIHRVGRVEVGEISLIIAVASPHRREAFEGCRYAIETLKRMAPIWKREVYADGESSWI